MNNKLSFQYAILKYIHDPTTEEFLNVGLVVYSKDFSFFRVQLLTKYKRITQTFPGADGEFYRRYIIHLQRRFIKVSDNISEKTQHAMFKELPENLNDILIKILPPNDSSIQFSAPNGGLASDLDLTFENLYSRLIEYYIPDQERTTRVDEDIWKPYNRLLKQKKVLSYLRPTIINTPHDNIEFQHAWKNGRWKMLQPVSFDLAYPTNIKKKAKTWLGNLTLMRDNKQWSNLYFLLGKPRSEQKSLINAYGSAKDILMTEIDSLSIKLIEEDEAEDFTNEISPQIEEDSDIVKKE